MKMLGAQEGAYVMAYRPALPVPVVGVKFDRDATGWLLTGGTRWGAVGIGWHRIRRAANA